MRHCATSVCLFWNVGTGLDVDDSLGAVGAALVPKAS